jgi:general secretion pathway protein K
MRPPAAHSRARREGGVALLLVMAVVFILAALAAGFAWSMRVEGVLARNFRHDSQMEWLGRSGVEYAKWWLSAELQSAEGRQYDGLNQGWAGGHGYTTNELLAEASLTGLELGRGRFSVKITDMERRLNINSADRLTLEQAMNIVGVDASAAGVIVESILDWRDPNGDPGINGAESDDYYLRLDPPYVAKNGPVDDISELLLVRGVTPDIFWGGHATNSLSRDPALAQQRGLDPDQPVPSVGLVDLFTAVSGPQVNINTCSAEVLQLAGLDPITADIVLNLRRGPDGVDGTEDDAPLPNVAAVPIPSTDQAVRQRMAQLFTTRSLVFEVTVTCELDGETRQFRALIRRNNQRDIPTLLFHPL